MPLLKNNTWQFDSMAALHQHVTETNHIHCVNRDNSWVGFIDGHKALAMTLEGDMSRVDAATAMLNKFDIHIDTSGSEMALGVAGFAPSVADYLGGSPEAMYCMAETQNERSPLNIIVDLTSSHDVSAADLNTRGTAILAAVMSLAAVRPITLEVVCMGNGHSFDTARFKKNHASIARVRLNSSPIDLGTACYALCHPGFARHIMYGVQDAIGFDGTWGRKGGTAMNRPSTPEYREWALDMLDADPESTLYIPAISSLDEAAKNPAHWIESILAKYSH